MGREKAHEVIVIVGLGPLGTAIARRLGTDYPLVLADKDRRALDEATGRLTGDGYEVHPALADVTDSESVARLAAIAQSLGGFRAVVRTEGNPPAETTAEEIIADGVLGTANILDAFGRIARPGSVAVCVAGIAGTLAQISKEDERALVRTPARKLARLRALESARGDKDTAYPFAMRAIQLRVEAASIDWGLRGGRTVSITPGVVAIAQLEAGLLGLPKDVRSVVSESPSEFVGGVDNVVDAVEFAISEDASFITGTDLRVDGGAVAAARRAVKQGRSCSDSTRRSEAASCREKQATHAGVSKEVVVITGSGGMGTAIARRLGAEYALVLADYRQEALESSREHLERLGYEVHPVQIDVSDQDEVRGLAAMADSLGRFRAVVHTAGVSPVQASTEQIAAVDLVGTAYVLEEFGKIAQQDSVAVCVASMAGYMTSFSPEVEGKLATAAVSELRNLPVFDPAQVSPQAAYPKAKRGNILRAEAAAVGWRKSGARVVSVSPGIILTPMGQQELTSKTGIIVRVMIAMSGARRAGEPEEVAAAVAFLVSEKASFVSGTDLLIDGGVIAWMNTVRRGGAGVIPRMLGRRLRAGLMR